MSDWTIKLLGDVATLQRGHDLPSSKRNLGGIPVMGSAGITGFHNEAKIYGEGVFIGRSGVGSMGAVSYTDKDHWPLNTVLYVKDFHGNHPKFIYYLFKTINFRALDSGTAQASLNRNAVHLLDVKIPDSYSEQKEIADILTSIEDKIELNRQTNKTLEHIVQAIFKSWFVDFEPTRAKVIAKQLGQNPQRAAMAAITGKSLSELNQLSSEQLELLKTTAALFPDSLIDSELGRIPERWSYSDIGNEVTVVGGGTPSTKKEEFWIDGQINWTTPKDMSNLTDKVLLKTSRRITQKGLAKISSGLLPVDAVLMSSRAPVGYLAITKIPVAINQGYIAMKCDKQLPPEYVLQWAESVMDEIKQRASGTIFPEISKKNFKSIPVIVPNRAVLSEFSRISSSLYETIKSTLIETNYLTDTRDTLLPKLLSGDLSVRS